MDDFSIPSSPQQSSSSDLLSEITERINNTVKQKFKSTKEKYKQEIAKLQESSNETRIIIISRLDNFESELKSLQDSVGNLEHDKLKQKAVLGNHISSMSEVNLKIDKFSEDVDFIRSSIVELTSDVSMKASVKDVTRVSDRLTSFCPLHYAQGLEAELRTKAANIDLQALQKDLKFTSNEVHEKYAEREPLLNDLHRLEDRFDSGMRLYVSTQFFSRVTNELQKTCDLLRHKIEESTGELRRKADTTKEDLETIRRELATRSSLAQMYELKRQVGLCATTTQLDSFAHDVQDCQKAIDSFKSHMAESLEAQDEVLQRYDEIFLDKASKTDVKELDLKLQAVSKHISFERRVDEMEIKINSFMALSAKQTEESEGLREQVEVFAKTVKNVKSEKRDIAMLKSTLQDVLESLSAKSDKSEVSSLRDSKSSSEEVTRISKALGMMYRIDKLTIVLLQHTIKYLNGTSDFKAMEFGSVEWLLKHAELVASWVNVYEPIENDVSFPSDFQQLIKSQRQLSERTPTVPTMKTPISAGLALLTPGRKSRPVTPTYLGSGRLTTSLLPSRHVSKRAKLNQPPSLDSTLFHS